MRINKIQIRNILGLESLDIEPGMITQISGENGAGKTSILEAIRCALSGGTDATLLRAGAESGEVVLILEDGTTINRKVTSSDSSVSVVHPEFGKISKPAQFLKKLSDALSLNPIEFLTAKKDQRVDYLLKAVPMQVTAEQLAFVPMTALNGISLDGHALEVIGKVARSIYDLRTGVNRAEKEKRATAKQMTETLPADAPEGDWSQIFKAVTDERESLKKSTSTKVLELRSKSASAIQATKDGFVERKSGLEAERDRDIERLRQEFEQAAEKIRVDTEIAIGRSMEERDARIAGLSSRREKAESEIVEGNRPRYEELSNQIAQATAMVEQHAKAEKTRELIGTLTKDADILETESSKLTHALSRLEILKASLLEKLPIEGLEVRDGDIFIGAIPFDRVNESKRIRLAIEISKLRAGSLGLVAVDGLERLDAKTFELFKKEAAKSNLQFVISRVSEGPLSITTEGQEVA